MYTWIHIYQYTLVHISTSDLDDVVDIDDVYETNVQPIFKLLDLCIFFQSFESIMLILSISFLAFQLACLKTTNPSASIKCLIKNRWPVDNPIYGPFSFPPSLNKKSFSKMLIILWLISITHVIDNLHTTYLTLAPTCRTRSQTV